MEPYLKYQEIEEFNWSNTKSRYSGNDIRCPWEMWKYGYFLQLGIFLSGQLA